MAGWEVPQFGPQIADARYEAVTGGLGRRQIRTLIRAHFHIDPDESMSWVKERELTEGLFWWLSRCEEWPSIHDIFGASIPETSDPSAFGITVRKASA